MKKVFALVLCMAILFGVVPLGEVFCASAAAEKSNAAITITGSKYVAKGKKITLEADQPVTWKTSDKKVATVTSGGVVKGIKAGKVTITAVSKANKKVTKAWKMTVTKKPVSSIKITGKPSVLSLDGTKTVTLKAVASPSSAAQSFTWKSNHPEIAKVSSKGKVTAVKPGIAKITATATDGSKKKATFTITVKETYIVWSAGGSTFPKLVDQFLAEHPEYAYVEVRTESHGMTEIGGDYQQAAPDARPDLFVFAQDQLAHFVSIKALATVSTSGFASDCAKGTVAAVKVGGKAYGYPISASNGFFLYYDKNIITNPSTLEGILETCESAGKTFHMELTSGWYNASFFYGAGCKMDFPVGKDGSFTGVSTDVGGSKGVKAVKAMAFLAASSAFVNNSSAAIADENTAAIVSGVWDASTLSQLWGDGYAAAKLPTVNGMQMYSYSGHIILGVRRQDGDRLAFSKKLAEYLTSTEAQVLYHEEEGTLPARKSAQKKVKKTLSEKALLSQMNYSVPQPLIPGAYWAIAATLGQTIIDNATTLTDAELSALAQQYQKDIENCIK